MKKITLLLFMITNLFMLGQDKLEVALGQYNNAGVWEDESKREYTYDNDGNVSEENYFIWDTNTESWMIYENITNTYNGSNRITQALHKDSNNGVLVNSYRTDYTYDDDGKLLDLKDYDYENGSWVLIGMTKLNYNGDVLDYSEETDLEDDEYNESEFQFEDGVLQNINIYAEDESGELGPESKREYSYNLLGLINEIKSFDWVDGDWVANSEITTKTYDALGNILTNVEMYDSESYTDTYTYDTSELLEDYIHPFVDNLGFDGLFDDYNYVSKLTSSSDSDSYRTVYQYTGDDALASTEDFNLSNVKIYPNPSSDFVSISLVDKELEKIELYTVLGKKIVTEYTEKLDIQNLTQGVYLLKGTTTDGSVFSNRIIKE